MRYRPHPEYGGRSRLLIGIAALWAGLSFVSDGLTLIVLPNRLDAAASSSASTLGLVTFAGLLAAGLVQPLAGKLSDAHRESWGRRSFAGLAVGGAAVAALVLDAVEGVAAIAAVYVVVQLATGAAQAAQQGLLADVVPAQRRGLAAGWRGFMDVLGATLAFVVLGEVVGAGSAMAPFIVAAALMAAFVLSITIVGRRTQPLTPIRKGSVRDLYRIDVRRHRGFVVLAASRFLFLLGTFAVGRFLLLFVAERQGLSVRDATAETGMLLGTLTLVTALASPFAGRAADASGRRNLMYGGCALSAAGCAAFTVAPSLGWIFGAGLAMAIGSACYVSANFALTLDLSPADQAARFLGVANLANAAAAAVAGLFGPLVDRLGFDALFGGGAVCFVLSAWALRTLHEPTVAAPAATRIGAPERA